MNTLTRHPHLKILKVMNALSIFVTENLNILGVTALNEKESSFTIKQ